MKGLSVVTKASLQALIDGMSEGELQETKAIVDKKLEAMKDTRRRNAALDRDVRRINAKVGGFV